MKLLNKIFSNSGITTLLFAVLLTVPLNAETTKRIDNFKLKDYNGKDVELAHFMNSKAIVIMFISTQCPVSNSYNERMVKLHNDYKGKNISFMAINSNKQEGVEEMKAHSREHQFEFPVLKDVNNVVADKFDAGFTPEIYVLNGKMEIIYHGRIDDSRREGDVKTHDLRNALNEILNDKKISVSDTKAFGCTIKRIEENE